MITETSTSHNDHVAEAATAAGTTTQTTEIQKPKVTPSPFRHEWYQTDSNVIISIFAKGNKTVQVDFAARSVTINISLNDTNSRQAQIDFDPLFGQIDEKSSAYQVLSTKIEITLKKGMMGLRWPDLLGSEELVGSPSTVLASVSSDAATTTAHSYPSSSKKKSDWNKLDKSVEEEKPEGEQALNKLFKDIFASGSDETKKAMMKSFTESNGTALSTNWEDVGKKRVEITPPEGMVAKPYQK